MATAVAKRGPETPCRIDLKFKVDPSMISSLLGFMELRNRSKEEEKQMQEKKVVEAGGDKDEVFIFDRTDTSGTKQGDTGGKIWDNGRPGHCFSMKSILEDLLFCLYTLDNVYSFRKGTESMVFIVFCFEQKKQQNFPGAAEFMDKLQFFCQRTWQNIHIWDNPDKGSVTINSANSSAKVVAPELRLERTNAKGILKSSGQKPPFEGIYLSYQEI